VTGITTDSQAAVLELSDGSALNAEGVVLAIGNLASSVASVIPRGHNILEDHLNLSPWLEYALTIRFPGERILLIGSGLTAVDSVIALQGRTAACSVYMLSRRGIVPQVHNLRFTAGEPPILRSRGQLLGLFREVRAFIHDARQAELCWRTIVDSLRPLSNELWKELSATDRKRFLSHLKTYWEAHRHRMAPEIRARLNEYIETGKLNVPGRESKGDPFLRARRRSPHPTAPWRRINVGNGPCHQLHRHPRRLHEKSPAVRPFHDGARTRPPEQTRNRIRHG
jgi:uncharacterized NAD(P)/FAD-binding protein YdhS